MARCVFYVDLRGPYLYEAGLPLSQVAKRLDVNQEAMRMTIWKAGVVLRAPTKVKTA